MKKTFSTLLLILTACVLLCVSCNDSKAIQMGTLVIRIEDQDGFRGIAPVPADIAGYSVSVLDAHDELVFSKNMTTNGGNSSCKVSLAVGEYSVCVSATNIDGKTIGEGSATVLVEPGKTVSCSIVIHEIQGNGIVFFSYNGVAEDELKVEILDASMAQVDVFSLDYSAGVYSGEIELPNGFYMFTVSKTDGTVIDSDTIRVVANQNEPNN